MRIIFFGTPDYVLPIVKALHKKYNTNTEQQLVAVVTQKPKPTGRHGYLTFSAVDDWAHKRGIKVITDPDTVWESDLGIVASYGNILSKEVINRFKYGLLNIHPSCLPDLRGATPIPATILRGDTKTCVSIIKMDDQMDHGPVVSSFKEEVKPDDTTETLRTRLFEHSAEFLLELLPSYLSGKINLKTQDHEQASFTTLLKKSDGYISPKFIDAALEGKVLDEEWEIKFIRNYSQKPTAQNIYNFVRAMHSWPNAWTEVSTGKETKRLKILSANLEPAVIASGARQSLVLNKVQLEGKNETTWDQLKLGYPSLSFQN
jgi:methionyl-tRNA formyltransferase